MVPTISNTLSKFDLREEMSLSFASLEDAASRPGGGKKQAAISNERIHRGEELLNTYVVRSNAIPGGMGNVWKVYHKSWNTELAMKRPQPVFFAEAGDRSKQVFIAECELFRGLYQSGWDAFGGCAWRKCRCVVSQGSEAFVRDFCSGRTCGG